MAHIVLKNQIDKQDTSYKSYEWNKIKILEYQESKLYQEDLNEENKYLDKEILFEFKNKEELQKFKITYKYLINKYYPTIREYKLKKNKDDENTPKEHKDKHIFTKSMYKLEDKDYMNVTITFIIMLKMGKLWKYFEDNYNVGNIFYKQKDRKEPLTPANSRCLISCDNRLKILCRFLKDYIIDNIFINNIVNTNIHRAKRCYVKYIDGNELKRKVCFDSVSNISKVIHLINTNYMLLDLSNAFNNVKYSFLEMILNKYLLVDNDSDKKNISRSITRLIYLIKYHDKREMLYINRNKGIPQGSSISSDLFIICMDYILNEVIDELWKRYSLKYNGDYKLICFIDDILIILKNDKGDYYCNDIYYVMEEVFNKYNFMLNAKKSKRSKELTNSILSCISNEDKYLGIFIERDLNKYLDLLETEIRLKYKFNPKFKSYSIIEKFLKNKKMKDLEKMQLRGKIQYALSPYASNIEERHNIFMLRGYTNIANELFKIQ